MPWASVIDHLEPINLCKNYYGEKYAMYFAFLVHHFSMLFYGFIPGLLLFFYQLVLSYVNRTPDQTFLESFLHNVDNVWNYFYVLFMAIWATLYVESWKRTQNVLRFVWGLNDSKTDSSAAEYARKRQHHTTTVIGEVSGLRELVVLKKSWWNNILVQFAFMTFFCLCAIAIWGIIYLGIKPWIKFDNADADFLTFMFFHIAYSICTIKFSGYFARASAWLVNKENHEFTYQHENSSSQKTYIL